MFTPHVNRDIRTIERCNNTLAPAEGFSNHFDMMGKTIAVLKNLSKVALVECWQLMFMHDKRCAQKLSVGEKKRFSTCMHMLSTYVEKRIIHRKISLFDGSKNCAI
jgi:hypothetical protein